MHCQSLHRDCKHSHVRLDWCSYYSYADPLLCRIPKADVLSGRLQKRQKPSPVSHFNPLHLHPSELHEVGLRSLYKMGHPFMNLFLHQLSLIVFTFLEWECKIKIC